MKKIVFAAIAAAICITSCKDATPDKNSDAKKNIAISHAINTAFETGDVNGIDSMVADNYLDHTDHGDKKGRDSLKAMVKFYYTNFKNMKTEKIREVADEDYVWSWMHYSGTSDGTAGAPKGPYEMKGIEITRFKAGKAVEHWGFMDLQDMMKIIAQPMNNAPKMDTAIIK